MIIEGIEIILNNNFFQFNNVNYIQTQGTTMATKMAPTYALPPLAYLEENLSEMISKKYGNDIKEEFYNSWKRCLDDCFIFSKSPWRDINELHNILQNLNPKIIFLWDTAQKNSHF